MTAVRPLGLSSLTTPLTSKTWRFVSVAEMFRCEVLSLQPQSQSAAPAQPLNIILFHTIRVGRSFTHRRSNGQAPSGPERPLATPPRLMVNSRDGRNASQPKRRRLPGANP